MPQSGRLLCSAEHQRLRRCRLRRISFRYLPWLWETPDDHFTADDTEQHCNLRLVGTLMADAQDSCLGDRLGGLHACNLPNSDLFDTVSKSMNVSRRA